jgi:hypothetical protein
MKKIALISTFCDTEEKQNVLRETIIKIKSLGVDVMALGPNFIPIKNDIIDLCDFFFYTKENPVLKWPDKAFTHWRRRPLEDGRSIMFHECLPDYGWSALYQTKKLSQIALTFDYDIFYHMIYDVEIDEIIESELIGSEVNLIHPRRDPRDPTKLWETTLHFMIFDREIMESIEKEIDLNSYRNDYGFAENEASKWTKKFPIKISNHCVKDRIYYYENFDFFNYSMFDDFKMFLSKNDKTQHEHDTLGWIDLTDNLRICLYDFNHEIEIEIEINGEKFIKNIKEWEIIEFPYSSTNIRSIIFTYNNKVVDFTDRYEKISMNQVYYNR